MKLKLFKPDYRKFTIKSHKANGESEYNAYRREMFIERIVKKLGKKR